MSGIGHGYCSRARPFLLFVFLSTVVVTELIGWHVFPFKTALLNNTLLAMGTVGALIAGGRFLYCLGPGTEGSSDE